MQDDAVTLTAELAEVMRLVDGDDVNGALDRFVSRGVRMIPGCDQAMIVARAAGRVEVLALASQERLPSVRVPSPVIDALTFREPRRLVDVATDQRWPAYSAHLAELGFGSCLALPLATAADPAAVLALFAADGGQFSELSHDLVMVFAMHAGVAFDNITLYHDSRTLIDQLRTALRTRSIIGSAQGLLMHRNGYDLERSFEALRTASQNHNIKLRDLAGELIAAHEKGDLEMILEKRDLSGKLD